MNKQPFYNEVSFIFTTTREISQVDCDRIKSALERYLSAKVPFVRGSLSVDHVASEPGDPADLL